MRLFRRTERQGSLSQDDVRVLAGALDDALLLTNVEAAAHVEDPRSTLARYIVHMAGAGERDRTQLAIKALEYFEENLQNRRAAFRPTLVGQPPADDAASASAAQARGS
jgi:hypothetical protein